MGSVGDHVRDDVNDGDSDDVNDVTSQARLVLDAWRASGADRLDPVRFYFIEALDRRAAGHSGEARRILDERLSKLIEAYADDLERAAAKAADVDVDANRAAPPGEPAPRTLAGLIDYIASQALSPSDNDGLASQRTPSYPELEVLDYFRETWTKVSTEKQFRQSLAQVPGNAGPLNSSSLVHRSLSLMRQLSPGYLQQFLSYVDALSWMEQMTGGSTPTDKEAPRSASARKSARGKPR
ncbi:hypothetical protein AWB69_04827 [Caballeronia udeis]|uniref:DUF2894 domain-containing protein n=1 Tax=Caballeronia udeis TaxID=1232866 RepID=A0A158HU75_9BURK|nr:DUF2894 domain-containing protein [Caballeronia udeis]SAL47895.1 hypothetical protein AWB69_04827 [Caballeronia udeis]